MDSHLGIADSILYLLIQSLKKKEPYAVRIVCALRAYPTVIIVVIVGAVIIIFNIVVGFIFTGVRGGLN